MANRDNVQHLDQVEAAARGPTIADTLSSIAQQVAALRQMLDGGDDLTDLTKRLRQIDSDLDDMLESEAGQ